MTTTIHHGDCVDILPTLAPGSVQTIVTSPPYLGLRDYGIAPTAWPAIEYAPMPGVPSITVPAQVVCLGLEDTAEAYIAHLVHVFRLARPALREDGSAWLNIGDSYQSGGGGQNAPGGIVGQPGMRQGNAVRPPKPKPQRRYRLRRDLTPEQQAYVLSELAKSLI